MWACLTSDLVNVEEVSMGLSNREAASAYALELANLLVTALTQPVPSETHLQRGVILSHEVCRYLDDNGAEELLQHHYREDTFTRDGAPKDDHALALEQERLRGRSLREGLLRAQQEPQPLRQRRALARLLVRAICLAIDIPTPPPRGVNLLEAMADARKVYNALDLACRGMSDPGLAAHQVTLYSAALRQMFTPRRAAA